MCLDGSEVVVGIRLDALQGENLKANIAFIYGLNHSALAELARAHGFVAPLSWDEPCVLAIPHAFIVVDITRPPMNTAKGIKWAFITKDEDIPLIRGCMDDLVASFPEANSLVMSGLMEALEAAE